MREKKKLSSLSIFPTLSHPLKADTHFLPCVPRERTEGAEGGIKENLASISCPWSGTPSAPSVPEPPCAHLKP